MIYQCFIDESFMFGRRDIAGFNVENIKDMDGTLM